MRAGISEHVAMKLTGHKTASVFRRYDIISDGDLVDAAQMLDAASMGTIPGTFPGSGLAPAMAEAR